MAGEHKDFRPGEVVAVTFERRAPVFGIVTEVTARFWTKAEVSEYLKEQGVKAGDRYGDLVQLRVFKERKDGEYILGGKLTTYDEQFVWRLDTWLDQQERSLDCIRRLRLWGDSL